MTTFEAYLQEKNYSDSTAAVYARIVRRWGDDPESWLEEHIEPDAPAGTLGPIRCALRAWCGWKGIEPIEIASIGPRGTRLPLTAEELSRWEAAIAGEPPCAQATIARLILLTGYRISEAVSIPYAPYATSRELLVRGNAVTATDAIDAVFAPWLAARPDSVWLFPGPNPARAILPSLVRAWMRERRGDVDVTPFRLRHTREARLKEQEATNAGG